MPDVNVKGISRLYDIIQNINSPTLSKTRDHHLYSNKTVVLTNSQKCCQFLTVALDVTYRQQLWAICSGQASC